MHPNEPEVVGTSRKQSEVYGSSRNPSEPMPPRCDFIRHFEHQFQVFFCKQLKIQEVGKPSTIKNLRKNKIPPEPGGTCSGTSRSNVFTWHFEGEFRHILQATELGKTLNLRIFCQVKTFLRLVPPGSGGFFP